MKSLTILGVASALFLTSGALAQDSTPGSLSFTMTGAWEEVEWTGGLSPNGMAARAGNNTGTIAVTNADGTVVNATARCVGMNQHPSQIFSVVISCDTTGDNGLEVAWLLGCNPVGEPDAYRGLGCVGRVEVKNGEFAGAGGSMTQYFNWSDGTSTGTGQWYPG